MKFSLNWINKYTNLPCNNLEELNRIIDRIAYQIVDVDERWLDLKDTVIDVDNKIITNKPYCFGHRGLAREIAVMLNQNYSGLEYPLVNYSTNSDFKVIVQNPELCPRFCCVVIKNITVSSSPQWLVEYLESIGQRSINNIVDLTNFIMYDTAQPVHAYDYDKISQSEIIVRNAKEGEKIKTLDGIERSLNENTLLISSSESPLGIAGVMGGLDSSVTENTKNIVLEIASFNPKNIRQTAKYLKHRTDAVTRFEKGIDPTNIPNVMNLLVSLILEICGGEITSNFIDINNLSKSPIRHEDYILDFNPLSVNKLLGFNVSDQFIKNVFDGFGIKYLEIDSNLWKLTIPSYRPDIKENADIIENIGRMYGYQNIPSINPINELRLPKPSIQVKVKDIIRNTLCASGLDEVITYSMVSQKDMDNFSSIIKQHSVSDLVKIVNPLSEEYVYMRNTLIPSLIKVVSLNSKNFQNFGIYEIGKIYKYKDQTKKNYEEDQGVSLQPEEKDVLSIMYYSKDKKENGIFYIKGSLENLFKKMQIKNYKFNPEGSIFINDKLCGRIGVVSQNIAKNYEIKNVVSYCEIEIDILYNSFTQNKQIEIFSRNQGSSLEYSVFVPIDMPVQNILDKVPHNPIIINIEITDIYKKIEENKKSIGIKLTLQKLSQNITDSDIYDIGVEVEKNLKEIDGLEIRGGGVTKPRDYKEQKSQPILAAEILDIQKHPQADRLVVTKVLADKEYIIVTGANNIKVGDIVPVALPGTKVPGLKDENGNNIVMKVAKLRGVDSYGMMLAGDELGINNDHEGIYQLDKEIYKPADIIDLTKLK